MIISKTIHIVVASKCSYMLGFVAKYAPDIIRRRQLINFQQQMSYFPNKYLSCTAGYVMIHTNKTFYSRWIRRRVIWSTSLSDPNLLFLMELHENFIINLIKQILNTRTVYSLTYKTKLMSHLIYNHFLGETCIV